MPKDEETTETQEAPISQGGPSLMAEVTDADANPAFYPKDSKSEAQHGEAEKAGHEYPGPVIEDESEVPFNSPQYAAVAAEKGGDQHQTVEEDDEGNVTTSGGSSGGSSSGSSSSGGDSDTETPARNASTATWRDYAVNKAPKDNRYTQEEADAASRDEIAAYYLGDS